jgi:hypothetical protein
MNYLGPSGVVHCFQILRILFESPVNFHLSEMYTLQDVILNMDGKVEQLVIIKFLCGERANLVEIHSRLMQVFQEDSYTLSNIYE